MLLCKLIALAPAVLALPLAQTESRSGGVSITSMVSALTSLIAPVTNFSGNYNDQKTLARSIDSALNNIEQLASEIANGPRLDEDDAIAVIAAVNPIFAQADLLAQAMSRKKDDARIPDFLDQAADFISQMADGVTDLSYAIDGAVPAAEREAFHATNNALIKEIRGLSAKINPPTNRKKPLPYLPSVPMPAAPVAATLSPMMDSSAGAPMMTDANTTVATEATFV